MPLAPGSRLGPYQILRLRGVGGMGEVYEARDTRLDRTVALKIIPPHIAQDVDLRRRLEREARAISALNHPNICTLYDVGSQDDVDYLVMEFLEGETLAERLGKGALPGDQTLTYGVQIAAALARAHRAGIVHRDLKPANVMLTRTGAKLLDFGVATIRPMPWDSAGPGLDETQGAPATGAHQPVTSDGQLLGTLQYMSPEQLEGKPADARSDIFSLGLVLYEMATGKKAFDADSPAGVMTAIMRDEPAPLRKVQPSAPPALEHVVGNCIVKDPDERWQSAQDVGLELGWIQKTGGTVPQRGRGRTPRQRLARAAGWAAAGALATWLALLLFPPLRFAGKPAEPPPSARSMIHAPAGVQFHFSGDFAGPPTFSPDGSRMVMVGIDSESRASLYVRRLDSLEFVRLAGTEGATFPFWSPDGRSIGFFADGTLKRLEATGGPPLTLAPALNPRGGSWGSLGMIVYEPDSRSELMAVPASGGTVVSVTEVERPNHTTHRWPHFLPDGKRFLFLAASHAAPASEHMGIYMGSTDKSKPQLVARANANGAYAQGHLMFTRGKTLFAQRFDPVHLALQGEATPVAQVQIDPGTWRAVFDASQTGLLQYQPAADAVSNNRIQWFSRGGQPLSVLEQGASVFGIRLSPDGNAVAVPLGDPSPDIWIFNVTNGTRRRLTFGAPIVNTPVWSPDGKRVAFSSDRLGGAFVSMHIKDSSGAGTEQLLIETALAQAPTDWSPNGRFLAYNQYDPRGGTHRDIWIVDVSARTSKPFERTDRGESDAQFSPDGKWVAYTLSMEREEIYVVPFRQGESAPVGGASGRWQVSTKGGRYPRWRRDGKELFYLAPDGTLMAASVDGGGPSFEVQAVRPLFKVAATPLTINQGFPYDVSADGARFVVNIVVPRPPVPLVLISGWLNQLGR